MVVFEARRVNLTCDDGRRRATFSPLTVPLDGRSFERTYYSGGGGPNFDQELYRVEGELRPAGRAKGDIFYLFDPWDPPETPNLVECSTFGNEPWDARRVR